MPDESDERETIGDAESVAAGAEDEPDPSDGDADARPGDDPTP